MDEWLASGDAWNRGRALAVRRTGVDVTCIACIACSNNNIEVLDAAERDREV